MASSSMLYTGQEQKRLILYGISTLQMVDKKVEILESEKLNLKDIYMLDNNNADKNLPENTEFEKGIPPIYFYYHDKEEDGIVYRELTPDTWKEYFGGDESKYPQITMEGDSSKYNLTATLPTKVKETWQEVDEGEIKTREIQYTWPCLLYTSRCV